LTDSGSARSNVTGDSALKRRMESLSKFKPEVASAYMELARLKKKYDDENARPLEYAPLLLPSTFDSSLKTLRDMQIEAIAFSKNESTAPGADKEPAKRAYIGSGRHFSSEPMENLEPGTFPFLFKLR